MLEHFSAGYLRRYLALRSDQLGRTGWNYRECSLYVLKQCSLRFPGCDWWCCCCCCCTRRCAWSRTLVVRVDPLEVILCFGWLTTCSVVKDRWSVKEMNKGLARFAGWFEKIWLRDFQQIWQKIWHQFQMKEFVDINSALDICGTRFERLRDDWEIVPEFSKYKFLAGKIQMWSGNFFFFWQGWTVCSADLTRLLRGLTRVDGISSWLDGEGLRFLLRLRHVNTWS